MKVLIVDDEKPARDRLRRMLLNEPGIEIVGEADSGLMALQEADRLGPELILLDIEMPELNGLGVAEALQKSNIAFIFVTAFDQHALKAFDLCAVDYLVKPVVESRLRQALDRLRSRKEKTDFSALMEKLSGKNTTGRLAVKCGAKYVVVDGSQISAILSQDHYSVIFTEGRELLADDPLDVLIERLDPGKFIRVHRNAAINVQFLQTLEREGDRKYTAILCDPRKTQVPVSRERLNELKARLGIR